MQVSKNLPTRQIFKQKKVNGKKKGKISSQKIISRSVSEITLT